MFNATEKEELKRIISKYVEQGRCFRPVHPDEVMKEINRSKGNEGCLEQAESTQLPTLPSLESLMA